MVVIIPTAQQEHMYCIELLMVSVIIPFKSVKNKLPKIATVGVTVNIHNSSPLINQFHTYSCSVYDSYVTLICEAYPRRSSEMVLSDLLPSLKRRRAGDKNTSYSP